MPRPSFNFQTIGSSKSVQTQTMIALLASGTMSIYGSTYEEFNMKDYTHALRMWDKEKKAVAVKLLKKAVPGAVIIQKHKTQNAKISFGSFIKTARIKSAANSSTYEVKRYSKDTFYFTLDNPTPCSRKRRTKRRGRPLGSKNKKK